MDNIRETELTEAFVSPQFCKHLQEAGLTANTNFFWKEYPGEMVLGTYAFDSDNYYSAANEAMAEVVYLTRIPAYNLKTVEKILPTGYVLELSTGGEYELAMADVYRIESVKDARLPDVFAKMALALIQKRCLDIQKINKVIRKVAA